MVTDRDQRRSWGIGKLLAIVVAAAALAGLGYLLYANAAHARADLQPVASGYSGHPGPMSRAASVKTVP
jgi:hypothetical protein